MYNMIYIERDRAYKMVKGLYVLKIRTKVIRLGKVWDTVSNVFLFGDGHIYKIRDYGRIKILAGKYEDTIFIGDGVYHIFKFFEDWVLKSDGDFIYFKHRE